MSKQGYVENKIVGLNEGANFTVAQSTAAPTQTALELLSELSLVLAGQDGFSNVVIRALKILAQSSGMQRAAVVLRHNRTEKLQVPAAYRLSAHERSWRRWLLGFISEGALQNALAGKSEALTVLSAKKEENLSSAAKTLFVCVPMNLSEEFGAGVFCVELAQSDAHNDKQAQELFRVVASMIAQACTVNHLVEAATQRMLDENANLRDELGERYDFSHIVGNSGPMRQVYEQIAQIACTNTTVLINGETGTGKELIAHALHINSPRADKPFIKVNCAALAESLIERELFGHERGAFTDAIASKPGRFELADGGTIFLDEIGEISPNVQIKLLRFLQEREFERIGGTATIKADVRVIAATNRELEKEVNAGRFRTDLFYRLNVFPIEISPLRERKEDIPLLVEYLLKKLTREHNKSVLQLSAQALEICKTYDWPGNVRELENALERAVVVADSPVIQHYHLPPILQAIETTSVVEATNLFASVEAYEKDLIFRALQESRGNRSQAARKFGVSERALAYKINKYAIDCEQFR